MGKKEGVKRYDRQELNRLVMQRDIADYMRARRHVPAQADGKTAVGAGV